MTVVGNVGTVAECPAAAAELDPDVVLVDFRLPDGTGPDAAAAIRGIRPAAKMIFLTREDTDAARFAAVQSGASAFIHKSKAAADVVSTIRDVARGKMLITPRTIASLLAKRKSIESQLERLTPREREVLRLLADGHPSRAMAAVYSLRSMIASWVRVRRKTQATSSTRWLPMVNISLAAPAEGSSLIELSTRTLESITAPNELIHASLSWLDLK